MSLQRFALFAAIASAAVLAAPGLAVADREGPGMPASARNVDLVGKARVHDAAENHVQAMDVLGDYAYLGAYQDPNNCALPGGVYVVDLSDPRNPSEVAYIPNTQASFVYGGVDALRVETPAFTGDVLIHTNDICLVAPGAATARGGVSLWDVSDPRNPQPLALGVGDMDPAPGEPARAHRARRVIAWDAGARAFAAVQDAQEGGTDIDLIEITDPRNPIRIAETGLLRWPDAQDAQAAGLGAQPSSGTTDMAVSNIGGNWLLLVPSIDAGFVVLNVNDPANPVFVNDSTFPDPDPLTGWTPPEGNANYAQWDRLGRLILGADQDLAAYRPAARIVSGPFSGEQFRALPATAAAPLTPDRTLVGPTYYLGLACASVPAAPSPDAIAVVARGTCTFQVKFETTRTAGYKGAIVFNDTRAAGGCEGLSQPLVEGDTPYLFVTRSTGFKILGIAGYDPARCATGPNPAPPAVGTRVSDVDARGAFDGWGYLHLLDAATLEELDVYAPAPAVDERYAEGFGILTARDIAPDPTHDVAYVAWSDLGLRVVAFSGGDLREAGHHVAAGGSDLYGVAVLVKTDGRRYIVTSERDTGLNVYRYGTDMHVRTRSRPAATQVGTIYRLTSNVTNGGTIRATGAVFRIRLPARVSFLSASSTQGRCVYRRSTRTVVCNLGSVAEDASSAVVTVRVRATGRGAQPATASVTAAEIDYDPRNNRARAQTTVTRQPIKGRLTGGVR
jgi:uncharacterized repeat protein (TIGR01451 family)